MDSLLGRKMSIRCSRFCAMLLAFKPLTCLPLMPPSKKGHLNLSVVTRPFSVLTVLMLLVSKLPIELNWITRTKNSKVNESERICVKNNQNLQKENMVWTWVWLTMTSDDLFASIDLISCRILETGTRSLFVHKPTHTLCWVLSISSVYRLVKFANSEEKMYFMCGSHLEALNFCAAW
jgi:hypothetical protein